MTPGRRSGRRRGVFAALRHVGDMAIDLGTANTVVYVRGRGIVLSEPSVVAIDERTGEVHAVGSEAQLMIGRTPASISADRPLRHGVIADFEVTEAMLRRFMEKVLSSRFSRPRLVMCAPSGVTEVERRAVEEASLSAGAREVHLIEESLAAAIGAGLEIAEPVGRMVVDIGGGTSRGRGDLARRARRRRARCASAATTSTRRSPTTSATSTAWRSARRAPSRSSSPSPRPRRGWDLRTMVRGRDLTSGLPREVELTGDEVRAAIASPLADILAAVHATLEETPPELAADITKEGILLAGGGALLRGLEERLEAETGMPTRVADAPLECVALGAGQSLEELDRMGRGRR